VFDRVETTDPQLHYSFPYSLQQGAYRGSQAHDVPGFDPAPVYDVYDYRLLRPPAQVVLRVQQDVPASGGHVITARQVRTITFTNPEVKLILGFVGDYTGYEPAYSFGPPVWVVNPGHRQSCPAISDQRIFGAKGVKSSVALAALARSPAFLSRGSLIKVQAGCKNAVKDCLASLDVLSRAVKLSRARTRVHRSLPSSLGRKTFVVPAGKTISVTVPLNARGIALAHAHKLHQVTLLLGSVGAQGKIVPTIRTVQLRTGR
jgi:hypothetical protein